MRIILASALLLAASAPTLATTFGVGSVDAGARSQLDTNSFQNNATFPVFSPGGYNVNASSLVADGISTVFSYVYVTGTWLNADAGMIHINWGWNVDSAGTGLITFVETNHVPANWAYTFTATGNGSFDGNYSITATGDKFGLQPLYGTNDLPFGPYGGTLSDPTGSGTFSVPLVNGQTYTIALFNFGNLSSSSGFDAIGDATANIDWHINYKGAVPEPASWAMMITGFGLVGAAARRRRHTVYA